MLQNIPNTIFQPHVSEFTAFLCEIKNYLNLTKKEPICLETCKYHYNLPADVKIYNLEEVQSKYKEYCCL